MICMFTCHVCGVEKAPFPVRERGKDEDIIEYMEEVREEMATAHSLRSPGCLCRQLDVYVPAKSNRGIGYDETRDK